MRLNWEPEPADWADGVRAVVPLARWSTWFAAAFAAFSAVLLVLGQTLPGCFGLACAALILAVPAIGVRTAFARDPIAGRAVTADVDGRTIRLMTVDGTAYSDIAIADLAGWSETERNFVLRTPSGGFHPLPGRAFSSTEDIDAFRAWLVGTLGPATPLR